MSTETDERNAAEIDGLSMAELDRMTRPASPPARELVKASNDSGPYEYTAPARVHSGRLYPAQDTPLAKCPTNLDLTTREGKAMLLAAGNPGDIDFRDDQRDGQGRRYMVVEACWFVIYPDRSFDAETGDVNEFARTVLIRRDGRTFRTSSAHVPHKIAAALDLYTPEEWRDGIPFRITERPSKNTKRGNYHDIRIEV